MMMEESSIYFDAEILEQIIEHFIINNQLKKGSGVIAVHAPRVRGACVINPPTLLFGFPELKQNRNWFNFTIPPDQPKLFLIDQYKKIIVKIKGKNTSATTP